MSWFGGKSNTPTSKPAAAGLDNDDFSSNEQAVPVPWWIGPSWRPLTWIVPECYNRVEKAVRQKVSKKKVTVGHDYYIDIAGIAGLGLIDQITGIESGGKLIWNDVITRPDDKNHAWYWRAEITTNIGTFYVYWGRPDQPVDTILLKPLATKDPALEHPAYRGQCLVICKGYYIGMDTATVPNTRVRVHRAPRPSAVGAFAPRLNSTQGESMVAGIVELMTDKVFGAGMSPDYFSHAEWSAFSNTIVARAGCHAPLLDRAQPVGDVMRDLMGYFDGTLKLENDLSTGTAKAVLRPGAFPHDGSLPTNIGKLTDHDCSRPQITITTPAAVANEVRLKYRDSADMLKEKVVLGWATDNVEARQSQTESAQVEMLGIIETAQAAAMAERTAAIAAEGEFGGSVSVRRGRAINADGSQLRAGDVVWLLNNALGIERVVRITRRRDMYLGGVELEFVHERGAYAQTPPIVPDTRPDLGETIPFPIVRARVFELGRELLGESAATIGDRIAVAFLAMRPKSHRVGREDFIDEDVMGFQIWDSPSGASYDPLGSQSGWAVRATLRAAVAKSTATTEIQLIIDADNIDDDRLLTQGASAQTNDTLLLVVGEEVMSVGKITKQAGYWTVSCLRERRGTAAAAHNGNAEAWFVYRDEITPFTHDDWEPGADRYFKLQPDTPAGSLDFSQVTPLAYRFKPAKETAALQVKIDAAIASAKVGDSVEVKGTVTAPGCNLSNVTVVWIRLGAGDLSAGEQTLAMTICLGAQKSECIVSTLAVPLAAGRYKAEIRAVNDAGGLTKATSGVVTVEAVEAPKADPILQAYKFESASLNIAEGNTGTILELKVTTTDRPVMVFYSLLGIAYDGGNPGNWPLSALFANVWRDGVGIIGSLSQFAAAEVNRSDTGHHHMSIGTVSNFFQDNPGAGEHTYSIRVENRRAGDHATIDQAKIYVLGLPSDSQDSGPSTSEP